MDWKTDKLKPTQPFFVLNSEKFRQEVYLTQGISHFYSFDIIGETDFVAVPDGCIDIVFEYDDGDITGYATGTVIKHKNKVFSPGRNGKKEIFGVRFMPGFRPAGLKVKLKDLIDQRIELSDTEFGDSMTAALKQENDFYQRIRVFLQDYTKITKKEPKPYGKEQLVIYIKDMVYNTNGVIRVHEMAERTGYSERYINKVFIDEMGFSPKTFCKIIQFQKALEFLNYGAPGNMTDAAVDLGFYDQSQFIKDFKNYSGLTPKQYLKTVQGKQYISKIQNTGFSCELF